MGTDIHGWVEIKMPWSEHWYEIIRVGLLLNRSYDIFGCLFGVRNYANFAPIAAHRGIPVDASEVVKQEAGNEYDHSHSWITWAEIKQIDWEEPAELPDSRIHRYGRDEQGNLVLESKASWDRDFAAQVGYSIAEGVSGTRTWPEGQEWEINGKIYRSERMKRGDVLGSDWRTLFKMMEALAEQYGDDHVRLIVWFDS
jgi:hypothetical protein